MVTKPAAAHANAEPGLLHRAWKDICERILGGVLLVLPVLITLWIIYWLYSILEKNIIDPLSIVVLWKLKWTTSSTELPYWLEKFGAPLIAIFMALALLYCLDYLSEKRFHWGVNWFMQRVPVISQVYNPVRKMFQSIEKQAGEQRAQRMVLVKFPHPGMKLPAFVTAVCRDSDTRQTLLCVYVPTTPVPTSGFFLLVPEEEVTELNWDSEQTLQAIISGGLTAPPDVTYFRTKPVNVTRAAAPVTAQEAPREPPKDTGR
jgi:uncharacterized membrane protein